ncbi:hypothetical protein F3P16_06065 [Acinetobacter baumannii]|nr:hypothetical protein F3P16_06065 [Acinetobacter baumannii]
MADWMNGAFAIHRKMQAKVEELEGKLKQAYEDVDTFATAHETLEQRVDRDRSLIQFTQRANKDLIAERDKLQKRVEFLEQELGAWKGKSIAAMINGMCGQCGKEPWQPIVSDKDGYALLHCFGCGANKYELIGEQALKGEGCQ